MLKKILFTIILFCASALVTFAQSTDSGKNKPPKEKPPVVSPKEKEKPKENPPKDSTPEKGNKPKKPDNDD